MTGRWLVGRPTAPTLVLILRVLFILPALPVIPALPAQTVPAQGLVARPDSTPVAGARVVLHQVGRSRQGPLDSVMTDRRGRFRFAFRPDTTAVYLLSARHAGIEYFSTPVHTNPERPDTAIRIAVYDTSSTAPVSLAARHLVLTRPGEDGSRSVLDLIVLRNDGQRTRISPDSLRPSWQGPLPPGTIGFELGESDVSPDAAFRVGDSLVVTAPLASGEKQITIQYLVPAGSPVLQLPFTQPVSNVNVLTEENDAVVSGGTLVLADSQTLQGRSFRRWTGSVPVGNALRVTLPARERAPEWLLAALVAAVVLVLGGAGWYALARRSGPAPASSDELLQAVAALDARYLGRETETAAEEWRQYQSERARLKALFETSLAAGGRNQ
jgi:hypothetical protein